MTVSPSSASAPADPVTLMSSPRYAVVAMVFSSGKSSIVIVASTETSTVYPVEVVAVSPTLPAASTGVTLAVTVKSGLSAKAEPGTSIEKRRTPASSNTSPSKISPPIVSVTTSPTLTSPPTWPPIATAPPASSALIMPSAVMASSRTIVAKGGSESIRTA